MTELTPGGSRPRTGLAASLLLHAAVVTAAILSLPHWLQPVEPRGIEVRLVPLLPSPEAARPRPAPRRPGPSTAPLSPPSLAVPPPAAGLPASPPSQPPATGDDPEARAKLAAVLRGSFGCSEESFARLSQHERDRCARWRQAQGVPGLEIPALIEHNKRAWFDATVAARNAPDHGLTGSCFAKPAHGIKLGPLPCYIELPKGPFSEDVDVPPEPDHSR
jgi:hypothetical protein